MNSQRISFLSVAWLLHSFLLSCNNSLNSFHFLLPCGSCVTCLFLEGHFGIHLEVASDSFCFLINSSWLLVFILYVFSLFLLGFNLYCLKGIHFYVPSWVIPKDLEVKRWRLCLKSRVKPEWFRHLLCAWRCNHYSFASLTCLWDFLKIETNVLRDWCGNW